MSIRMKVSLGVAVLAWLPATACTGPDQPAPSDGHMVIANVHKTADAFPAGWKVVKNPTTTVTAQMVEQSKVPHQGLQVRPESCAARLDINAAGVVGQVVESFTAKSPEGVIVTVSAAKLPDGPPPPPDGLDCRYATFSAAGKADGIITPAELPNVPGVKMRAAHIVTNYDDGSDRVADQYSYIGAADDKHQVTMAVFAGPAAQNLPKIDTEMTRQVFTKAIEAVRG